MTVPLIQPPHPSSSPMPTPMAVGRISYSRTKPTAVGPTPPAPPPLAFDPIIARVYGPTSNIYKDIFKVSPDAHDEELYWAHYRVRKEEEVELTKLAEDYTKYPSKDNAHTRTRIMLKRAATDAAYQIVINPEKRKQYDTSIGLVVEQPAATNLAEKNGKFEEVTEQQDFLKSMSEDDENNDVKLSVARKIQYSQPSTPTKFASTRHDNDKVVKEVAQVHGIPALTRLTTVKDERRPDECLYGLVESPTAVSEFDESTNADEDEASDIMSLGKPSNRIKKNSLRQHSRRSLSRRKREKKKAVIDTYYRDIYDSDQSDDVTFLYEEDSTADDTCTCVHLLESMLRTCVNFSDEEDDDSFH
ncbi:hypothetical protein ACHAXM_007857 [Skeletonema potamos]